MDRWLLEDDLSEYAQPWRYERLNAVERVLLAQRLPGEAGKTACFLSDLYRLLPPTATARGCCSRPRSRASALSTSDPNGLPGTRKTRARGTRRAYRRIARDPPPAGPVNPVASGRPGAAASRPSRPTPTTKDLSTRLRLTIRSKKNGKSSGKDESGRVPGKEADFFQRTAKKEAAAVRPQTDLTLNGPRTITTTRRLTATGALVPVSKFWLDYAWYNGNGPFLSRNLADASRNFTEMILALAVLDLPFAPGKHQVAFDAGRMTFTPADMMIAFHEQVRSVGPGADKAQILVSQNFYRQGDRFREENGERFDKFVTNEFVIHTVYGCQVVVTNPTSSRQRLGVLIQTPVGSIPVGNGQPTKTVALDLEPYHTQTIDYTFYFPKPGKFAHFPVHVGKNEALVASAAPFSFNVVPKPTKLDTESWEYVSQNGTAEQVLAFLGRENVFALDLERIAFRMKDKEFFEATIKLLTDRHRYAPTLWSYGISHNVVPVAREFLTHAEQIVAGGGPIVAQALVIDPVKSATVRAFRVQVAGERSHALWATAGRSSTTGSTNVCTS